ncbi:MAG: DUF86 domain-containing protein [Luteitalea sp.]|nr:DUF86 domain-containing protein [Luteitalea sp.]
MATRLSVLEENLRILAPFGALDLPAFIADPRNYGAAERFLHLAIEAVFDIGTHCIAALGLPRPSTYADIIPALAEAQNHAHAGTSNTLKMASRKGRVSTLR